MAPFTQAVGASALCWGALIRGQLQASNPSSDVVLIAENGMGPPDGLPDPLGNPSFNVSAAESYFGTPCSVVALNYQASGNSLAQDMADLQTMYDFCVAQGSVVYVCTPHPFVAGTFPPATVQRNKDQRDAIVANWPSNSVDFWTAFTLPASLDGDPAYLQGDGSHWNAAGNVLAASVFTATTGIGA